MEHQPDEQRDYRESAEEAGVPEEGAGVSESAGIPEDAGTPVAPAFAEFVTPEHQTLATEVAQVTWQDVTAGWAYLARYAIALAADLDDPDDNTGTLAQVFSAIHTLDPATADALALQMLSETSVTDMQGQSVVRLILTHLHAHDADLAGRWDTILSVAQDSPTAYRTHIQAIALEHPDAAARELWATLGEDIPQMTQLLEDLDVRTAANVLIAAAGQGHATEIWKILAHDMPLADALPILEHMVTTNPKTTADVLVDMLNVEEEKELAAKLLESLTATDPATAAQLVIAMRRYDSWTTSLMVLTMDAAIATVLVTALVSTNISAATRLLVDAEFSDQVQAAKLLETIAITDHATAGRLLTAMSKYLSGTAGGAMIAMDPTVVAELVTTMVGTDIDTTALLMVDLAEVGKQQAAKLLEAIAATNHTTAGQLITAMKNRSGKKTTRALEAMDPAMLAAIDTARRAQQ